MAESDVAGFRISPQQRRLWTVQSGPGHPMASVEVRVDGAPDAERLFRAVAAVVERHEVLRTAFPQAAGLRQPVQVVLPDLPPQCSVVDLRALPEDRRIVALGALAERRRPRALGAGAALEALLVVRGHGQPGRLLLRLPVACADELGLSNLVGAIAATYSGQPATDSLQYADLAEVLNELARDGGEGLPISGWGALEGWDEALEMPLQAPAAGAGGAAAAGVARARLATDALRAVHDLAAAEDVDAGAVHLAAWQALLHRLTGAGRMPVAVAASGRAFEGLGGALGLFERLVPVVSTLDGTPTFRQVCRRAAAALADLEEWQDSFDGGGAVPPFAFSYRDSPPAFAADGAVFTVEHSEAVVDRAGLWLEVRQTPTGAEVLLRFDRSRYLGHEVDLLAARYAAFLTRAAGAPDCRLPLLDLLLPAERRRFLVDRNRGDHFPAASSVPELFARRAAAAGDARAIVCGDREVSYRQLATSVGRLAARLRQAGVGPECVVGVCLETSPEAVVALLGVLASGGAFLPLDPSHPPARLAELASGAGAVAVVTDRRSQRSVPPLPGGGAPLLVEDCEEGGPQAVLEPLPPERLAYVLHTSGSTGRPKGVAVQHGSLANYLAWAESHLIGGGAHRILALTRLSFDACLKQLLGPLLSGGEVWLLPRDAAGDPASVLAAVAAEGSVLNCVPAFWRSCLALIESGASEAPRGLVRLLLGGEALAVDLLERTFAAVPGIEVWNLYGPTEATANASAARLLPGDAVDLGRPVADARVYLLDAHLQPLPAGMSGEIFVAGGGLARGYLGQPSHTAERFVPDPFAPPPGGGRLYRTGDRARFRGDGSLEFQGRGDRQVKLRGMRIEPGEIEISLVRHPAVAECGVELVRLAAAPALVAFVAAAPGQELPGERRLLRWLAERLPAHLVPTRVVSLEALPRLVSGKLDRAALAQLADELASATEAQPVPPRNAVEERLVAIWRDVLGIENVGVNDNFFRLGGHSLLAIRLLSRIRCELTVDLPMQAVMEAPDLAALAARLEEHAARGDGETDAIVAAPAEEWPLSLAEEKLWFLAQLDPRTAAYNIPAALRLDGAVSADTLAQCFVEISRRHAVLRSVYGTSGGMPVRHLSPARGVLPVVELSALAAADAERELSRLAGEEARRPFDLAAGPLLRQSLVRLGAAASAVLFTLHHIVSDGWSTGILLPELSAVYGSFRSGMPSPLPEPLLQYGDFARWQRRRVAEESSRREAEYWRERLSGLDEQVLAPDRQRPEGMSTRGRSLHGRVNPTVTAALRAVAKEAGATLYMSLLAAFKVLLAAESGRRDLCVGTDTANRERPEVQGLIGYFTNQLVLRTDLAGDPPFPELVGRVRDVALGAYAHQELPFHQLVSLLRPERDLGRTPLFQVMFSLQNAPAPERRLAGMTFSPLRAETATAVFDLSLYVREEEDGLALVLRFNTDLFRTARMERLLERYVALLARIADDPEARVEPLVGFLADEDRRQRTGAAEELSVASARRLDEVVRRRRAGAVSPFAIGGIT